jgi:Coenzyme PQQ synthesis protein D (PqqD)
MSVFQSLTVSPNGFAFDTITGESFTLNGCGHLILERLKNGETREQIAHFLCDKFGLGCNVAERDIADFFQQLNILGLAGKN